MDKAKEDKPFDYDQMRKERAEEGMRIYNHNQAKRPVEVVGQDKPTYKPSSSCKGWMTENPVKVKDYFSD